MIMEVFSRQVAEVTGMVSGGKEATVYLCRTQPQCRVPGGYAAAKVYRSKRFRAFRNNADYADSRHVGDRRMAKAIRKRTRVGQRASHHLWVEREWQVLSLLYDAGASVPEPLDVAPDAVLMELIGSQGVAAPQLSDVRLGAAEARRALSAVFEDLEILLDCELVHGDLSPYNILYHEGRPRLIDLPQAVDTTGPADAWTLFHRDVDNVCGYFRRLGVEEDALAVAMRLWRRYVR
jgi:RIO kinase 1